MLNLKNTLDGYLKNVEVIGNTVQDANNLANIRSVGDKVEGQELYKIDVVSCGKNLFDGELELGSFNDSNGANVGNTNCVRSKNFIPVDPRCTYTLRNNMGYSVARLGYDEQFNCIASNVSLSALPSNCRYIKFRTSVAMVENDLSVKFQLEEGTQATPYEPYKGDKLEILSPVQLEKVGDVADKIICKDGVWGVEKYIETVLLNGSEHWRIDTQGTFYISSSEWKGVPHKPGCVCITDIFSSAISTNDVNNKMFMGNSYLFMIRPSGVASVGEWKSYLNTNNLKVKYITTQPQFIPLPHDQQVKLRTFAGQTNIIFNTKIAGQVKAQVPKSLGAVVNTHTEQIEMLHNALKSVLAGDMYSLATLLYPEDFTQDNSEQDIMVIPE